MIRIDHTPDGHEIAHLASTVFNPKCDHVIARVENDELYGGVMFTGFTGASISIHMAGFRDNWANRDILWVAFHYPFEQLGVNKIFGQVGVHNPKALEIDLKLGFKEEARIKDVYPEGDMVLLAMYKADCRWLKLKPKTLKDMSDGRQE